MDDTPKYWIDETELEENTTGTEILVPEEEIVLPTIAEQKELIHSANDISEQSRGMLAGLVEMNSVAQTLLAIHNNETAEQRRTVITAWCESFINSRMRNNAAAETLKAKLLERLINNIDNLDLETTARIYNDLTDVSAVDAQQAMANINGGNMNLPGQSGGINLTINNATAEGASVVNNTLNAQPQQVQQLKETATLNQSLRAWSTSNIPLPKKKDY